MRIFKINSEIESLRIELINKAYTSGATFMSSYLFPFIMFSDMSSDDRLGYYDCEQNSITLSLDLIQPKSREALYNVFLHELAHCIQFNMFGGTSHDAMFRGICGILGISPEYSAAVIKRDIGLDNQTKVRQKVQKLLNLSKSDFEGEASSALEKARLLMEKYSLSYIENEDSENELFGLCMVIGRRIPTWKKMLGAVVSSLTGCFRIIEKNDDASRLLFYGTFEQVESALYLWQELEFTVTREAEKLARPMPYERVNRNEIKYGILTGMMNKIQARSSESRALVLASEKNKEIYLAISGAALRNSGGSVRVGAQFRSGVARGESMDIPSASEKRIKRIADK